MQLAPSHLTAKEARDILGQNLWEKLFTSTIVRNPWDRMFSFYSYRKGVRSIPAKWSFRDYVLALRNFVKNKHLPKIFDYGPYYYQMADFVLDDDGKILIDYIARYENRKQDLQYIGSRIGLPTLGQFIHTNKSRKENAHYSQFYDDETRELVRELCAKDIEMFG